MRVFSFILDKHKGNLRIQNSPGLTTSSCRSPWGACLAVFLDYLWYSNFSYSSVASFPVNIHCSIYKNKRNNKYFHHWISSQIFYVNSRQSFLIPRWFLNNYYKTFYYYISKIKPGVFPKTSSKPNWLGFCLDSTGKKSWRWGGEKVIFY